MVNAGQQFRIASKIERNLKQVLQAADGLQVSRSANAVGDNLIAVGGAGAWATGDVYALVKVQEIPLADYPVQGLPVHKLMICVEGDNATLANAKGSKVDAGYLAEIVARAKDMGCSIEVYVTAAGTQPADQATAGGTFAACRLLRAIRASVDTIGLGQ